MVILDAVIGTDGKVRDIRVLSSPSEMLARVSTDYIAGDRYSPTVVDGRSVEVDMIFALGY
jgi:Gram-negative bacterial TonB protein C-terminal